MRTTAMRVNRLNAKLKGFTIPELLIATAVFSTILVVSMAAFLQIGRMFYKGVTISQTKDSAQHILDSISADLQYADSAPNGPSGPSTYKYLCIGNSRYTYRIGKMVDSSKEKWSDAATANFGLLHDKLPGDSGCDDPFAADGVPLGGPDNENPVSEMLGHKMRLSNLSIGSSSPYNVKVYIAYGDNEVLVNPNSLAPVCKDDLKSSEFCSISNLNTTVSRNFDF